MIFSFCYKIAPVPLSLASVKSSNGALKFGKLSMTSSESSLKIFCMRCVSSCDHLKIVAIYKFQRKMLKRFKRLGGSKGSKG